MTEMINESEQIAAAYHEAAHAVFISDVDTFNGISIWWNDANLRWYGTVEYTGNPGKDLPGIRQRLAYRDSIAPQYARSSIAGTLAEAMLKATGILAADAKFVTDAPLRRELVAFLEDRERSEARPGDYCVEFTVPGTDEPILVQCAGVTCSKPDQDLFWRELGRCKQPMAPVVLDVMKYLNDSHNWQLIRSAASALLAKQTIEGKQILSKAEFLNRTTAQPER